MYVLVEAATLTPLCHNGQVVLSHITHEQQDVDMSCFPVTRCRKEEEITISNIRKNIWNVDDSIRSQKYKILKTPENLNAGKKNIFMHSHLRTATSFLNAWNCSGVGSVTFKIFTATSPTAIHKTHMTSNSAFTLLIVYFFCQETLGSDTFDGV